MTEEQNATPAPEGKSAKTKLAAAVIGGYVLGRTKKGGAALTLASWLSGNQAGPQAMSMARKGLTQVARSEQAAQIMKQVRGPLMEAAQKAATQAVLSRVTAIANGTTEPTNDLTKIAGTTVKGTAEAVSDTTKKAGGGVKGTAEAVSDTTKKAGGGVKGTAEAVSDTTKKAGGGVKGALGKLPGRKRGKAEEPKAEEVKPEEESDEGEEEEQARKPPPTKE
jgi:hypothetical protein